MAGHTQTGCDPCWSMGSGGEQKLLQRVLGILVAVLIVVWIVSNPAAAGNSIHGWITGLFTFFHHLTG